MSATILSWSLALGEDFSVDLGRLQYEDGSGRRIDYDFSSGTIDAQGVIAIPASAILQRPSGEADTQYLWEPVFGTLTSQLVPGACRMAIPQASIDIPPIPTATITVDGDPSDWDAIPAYLQDINTVDDQTAAAGSDVEYVKLAFSADQTRLSILIKIAGDVSEDLWCRMFFCRDSREIDKPGNFQVDFQHRPTGWEVVSQGWNSRDGWDWYPVDEQGAVAVNGSYLEASVSSAALGLDQPFYFSGRTMQGQPAYGQYDDFAAVLTQVDGACAIGAYGTVVDSSDDWTFEVTLTSFQNVSREQFYHMVEVDAGCRDDMYDNRITQTRTITPDGDPTDWAGAQSLHSLHLCDYSGPPEARIRSVYTAMDADNVYFMLETGAALLDSSVTVVEANFNCKPGQHFFHDHLDVWADLHVNVDLASSTASAWKDDDLDGNIEPVLLDGTLVGIGQVVEMAIPRSQIEEAAFFNATFVNTWCSATSSDPTYIDPVISPVVCAIWFTGTHAGTHYDNALILNAFLQAFTTDEDAVRDVMLRTLTGLDPASTVIDVRLQVHGGTVFTASFRIKGGLWETLYQQTLDGGRIPGFADLFPYVRLDTGHVMESTRPIPGDANLDCTVNILDLLFVRNRINKDINSGDNWQADVNSDGKINILDLLFVRNQLHTECTGE